MSLFPGLKVRPVDPGFDAPTAVMVPMVAAMLADSRIETDERVQIDATCATSPIFHRNSAVENEALIARASDLVEAEGPEKACRKAAQLLSAELRETAFAFAIRVIYADGIVDDLELQIMNDLGSWLGVAPERAELLRDAVQVLQNAMTGDAAPR